MWIHILCDHICAAYVQIIIFRTIIRVITTEVCLRKITSFFWHICISIRILHGQSLRNINGMNRPYSETAALVTASPLARMTLRSVHTKLVHCCQTRVANCECLPSFALTRSRSVHSALAWCQQEFAQLGCRHIRDRWESNSSQASQLAREPMWSREKYLTERANSFFFKRPGSGFVRLDVSWVIVRDLLEPTWGLLAAMMKASSLRERLAKESLPCYIPI